MNVPVACSRRSILRFIKYYLTLNETPYWFHQTLTFTEPLRDFEHAKPYLRKLLDSVGVELKKQYEVASLYILGRQERMAVHFHVLFLFYGQPSLSPEELRPKLWNIVWPRWKKLSNKAEPWGNRLTLRTKANGLWYLLQHVTIAKTGKKEGEPLWWGKRSKRLIAKNSRQPSEDEVRKAFNTNFRPMPPVYFSILQWPKERYGWRSLRAERKLGREIGFGLLWTWNRYKTEEFKKVTGVSKPVSDKEFIQFRKAHGFLI
jgi:hypothetical protein